MSARKITQLSLLAAAALVLYVIELHLPAPVPIPGVKLGLANIITLIALYRFRPCEAAVLVLVRVVLGALFAGGMSALLFSACGAAFCLGGLTILRKRLSLNNLPFYSVVGAMLHNTGQIAAALFIMRSPGVLAYLPILMVTGSVAGLFTGLCARAVERRLPAL